MGRADNIGCFPDVLLLYQIPLFFATLKKGKLTKGKCVLSGTLLHMPQPQYNRYEQGLRDLPTTTLIALADIYHTSTDYLLGRTNDPKPPVSL